MPADAPSATWTIAHLSDTHVGGLLGGSERIRRALDHVAALDPPADVVLVTGDVADHGTDEEYAEAAALLDAWPGPAPLLHLPGNHDVREPYARVLARRPDAATAATLDEAHVVTARSGERAQFVMLDSLVEPPPGSPPGARVDHGHLGEETLAWLDERLGESAAAGLPAYVCLHHPPVTIHVGLMDPIRLEDGDALAEVVGRHEHVVAVLVGHAHTACATTFAGRPLLVGGGIASTVPLDAEDLPVITDALPVTFAVHLVGADRRVVTHWRALPGV